MNLNDTEKMIQTQWIRIHYITDIVSAITSTKSRCCKKVKCSVTTGWQRPARHRRESGATCSRVTILTGGRDLVDMGNNGAFACRRAGSSLSESVSRSISRVHQRPLSRSVRTTQWTCLFWSSCAALFRTMRPREKERERESSLYTPNRPFFDLTFRRITISYRIFYCDRYLLERFAFNDLTKKGIS